MSSAEKHKPFVLKDRLKSFVYAYRGIKYVIATQHNMWIHILLMLIVVGMGFICDLRPIAWIVIIFAIAMVLAAEIFNSAIEALVDLHSPDYSEKAGRIKDMAAGAVLITAIAAVIAACIIFIPYIISLNNLYTLFK
ncbi:MAG: diacylglycerol kinase family protein [Bacteroidetes bacterium]|nr:diacylglycerol kinase family protein [Bacteroidota bacterium]